MDISAPEAEVSSTRPSKTKRRNRKRVAVVFGCTAAITAAAPVAVAQAAFNTSVYAHPERSNVQVCGHTTPNSHWACTGEKGMVHKGTLWWASFKDDWFISGTNLRVWWNHHGRGSWNRCSQDPTLDYGHMSLRASYPFCY